MALSITIFSIFMVFYGTVGYLLFLWLFSFLRPKKQPKTPAKSSPLSYSIIITVYNEKKSISNKIKDSIKIIERYKKHLKDNFEASEIEEALANTELIIASDASDDGTDDVVKLFEKNGVYLHRIEERGGKERAQKFAVSKAKGECIFFTDVRAEIDEDVLEKLNSYFNDEGVGAVSTKDIVIQEGGKTSGEGAYVKYEMKLRELESNFNSLIGLSGSGFAVRKSVALNMRDNIPSDFALLLEARKMGLSGAQASDIECRYLSLKTDEQEFSRKVRTVLRGMTAFFQSFEIEFFKSDFLFAWQLLSHKLSRWMVPFFTILASLGVIVLSFSSTFWSFALLLMILCYSIAFFGLFVKKDMPFKNNKIVKLISYFCLTNFAILTSWKKYLSGERQAVWAPSIR